jgi:hypothetical protein
MVTVWHGYSSKNSFYRFVLCLAMVAWPLAITAQTFISQGSFWRYLDTGVDPGTAWVNPSYDDSSWLSGPAQLGFGDGDEATVINRTNASGPLITAYFRNTFNVPDASAVAGLNLQLWRDDGAVVYLNGVELYRNNMPGGPVNYSTFAASTAFDDGFTPQNAVLSSSLLVSGANVIAVEVHQVNLTSSDISFDLALSGNPVTENHPPVANGQSVTVNANTPTAITLTGSDPDGDPLTFSIQSQPTHGLLSGSPPNVTYSPQANYTGPDAFTFTVNDGQAGSAPATVDIQVQVPSDILIARNAVWKYLDTGIDQGTAWVDPAFDDSSWAAGPAELGFGDGDEATVINRTNPSGPIITFYFRHTFNVADASAIPGLEIVLWRDDGAVVYLNGVEIYRNNMPAGEVNYSTFAFLAGDDGRTPVSANVSSRLLVNGANVLAVEVHQSAPTSSDISFALILQPGPEVVNHPPVANNQSVTVSQNTSTAITLTGSDPDGNALTFTILSGPTHGSLSGTPPNVTYTPNTDYTGPDSFTFKVNDGEFDSAAATVGINVVTPPDPPDIVFAIADCSPSQLFVRFDEPVDRSSAEDLFNYFAQDQNGNGVFFVSASLSSDGQTVTLVPDPSTPFIPGNSYMLTVTSIIDLSGDVLDFAVVPITFDTTPPTVTCSVAVSSLSPPNNMLVNVGLSATSTSANLSLQVYSDEPKLQNLTDAQLVNGSLQLRARRNPALDGRVYLIVVTSIDECGNLGVCCTTVVVPKNNTPASINSVNAQAVTAQANCSPNGAPSTPYLVYP